MFRGVTQLSLDNKGRLAIPARYRDELALLCVGNLVVTVDPSNCLLIYPQPAWEIIEQKLNELSSFHLPSRHLQRLLIGNASDVSMDSAARILISPPLRKFGGLVKDLVLVGQGTKFELWNEERWDLQIEAALEFNVEEMPPEFKGFSL